jgi:hypothetical protein
MDRKVISDNINNMSLYMDSSINSDFQNANNPNAANSNNYDI